MARGGDERPLQAIWSGDTPRRSGDTSQLEPPVPKLMISCRTHFSKAFRGLDGWRGEGSFRGWLFRIAGNLLKDRFRQNKGRVFLRDL